MSEFKELVEQDTSHLHNLTKEKLKRFLPKKSYFAITDELMDKIKSIEEDTGLDQNTIEEEILTHLDVLKNSKIKVTMDGYINAIKFIMLTNGGMTDVRAYELIFPERYDKCVNSDKKYKVNNLVNSFAKGALINILRKRMMIAPHITLNSEFLRGVRKLINLSNGVAAPTPAGKDQVVSPHVQMLAAKAVVEALKAPEEVTVTHGVTDEISASLKEQQNMRVTMDKAIEMQREAIKKGVKVEDVQKMYIEAEIVK